MKAEVTQLNPLDVQKKAYLTLCLRLGCSFLLQLIRWTFGNGAKKKQVGLSGLSQGLAKVLLKSQSSKRGEGRPRLWGSGCILHNVAS